MPVFYTCHTLLCVLEHDYCACVCAFTQVNAVLLTISLVSLAKSQCGMASKMESNKDEKRQKYMDVGK